ncbi:MAG: RagB/SusD family nutrient uptake outer membrane protein [Bacteroidales bacterium]
MKKYKLIRFLMFTLPVIMLFSCDSFLDIEPQQSVSNEVVYDTHEGVTNALNGAYEVIAGPELYAGSSIFHSDLVGNSNDMLWAGTFVGYRNMNQKNMDPNAPTITSKWITAYDAINITNNVLDNLDIVNESQRNRVEGEARFIRGIMYFELVRFYALPFVDGQTNDHDGVPLVLTPTEGISEEDDVSRSSVADVYEQIIEDLTEAKQLLADYPTPLSNGGRASSAGAAGFLARAYMATENWSQAAIEADFVIGLMGGTDALNPIPRLAFNNDDYTSEDVFMIRQNAVSNAGQANDGIATFFASLNGLGRGDVNISDSHMERYEEDDLRATITDDDEISIISDVNTMFYVGIGTNPGQLMTSKWGKHDANIPVIRLAEMILTRAEANYRAGSATGAAPLDDINVIRNRAGIDDWDNLDLDMIWEERFRELCFEGHLLDDLKRFRKSATPVSGPYADEEIMWDDGRLVLPIPQRETDTNPNLVQNEAYQ